MVRAGFYSVFLGIETPKSQDLRAMGKTQNARRPVLESVRIIQGHGLEIWAGLILGLDTDGEDAGENMTEFVEQAVITMPMLNLLGATPHSRLHRRLAAEGRLLPQGGDGASADSNIRYRLGQREVFRQYVECWRRLFEPRTAFRRLERSNALTAGGAGQPGALLPLRVRLMSLPRLLWRMGVLADYRREFWRAMLAALARGGFDRFATQMGMLYHCLRVREEILANPPVPADEQAPTAKAAEAKRFRAEPELAAAAAARQPIEV